MASTVPSGVFWLSTDAAAESPEQVVRVPENVSKHHVPRFLGGTFVPPVRGQRTTAGAYERYRTVPVPRGRISDGTRSSKGGCASSARRRVSQLSQAFCSLHQTANNRESRVHALIPQAHLEGAHGESQRESLRYSLIWRHVATTKRKMGEEDVPPMKGHDSDIKNGTWE